MEAKKPTLGNEWGIDSCIQGNKARKNLKRDRSVCSNN